MTKKPDPIDVHVANRIRMRRMMLGMSQEKVGDAMGVTFQQQQKRERGANRISAANLYKLATLFQVPITFFFEDLPNSPTDRFAAPTLGNDLLSTRDGLALAQAFVRIKMPSHRALVVSLAEEFAAGNAAPLPLKKTG
jgi:transcriptional regulator with XRE-family HTH domain